MKNAKGVMHFITNIQFLVCHLIKRITSIQQFSVTFSLTLFFFSVFFFFSRQVNNFLGFLLFVFQSQHSHLVIQQLLGHLDANSKNSATVRAGIVEVLLEAAAIAASGSVGKLQSSKVM